MYMKRARVPTTLALLFALVLALTACPGEKASRSQVLGWAEEAVAITRDVLPIFASAGRSSTVVDEAVRIGGELVTAFRANKDADAVTLTSSFIDATDKIVREIELFKDPNNQTLALAIIAGVRIAVRRISNYLAPAEESGMLRGAGPGTRSAAAKINDFRKEPAWRCRSAQTGRFQKMEYCRAHPDVSTVERVRRR